MHRVVWTKNTFHARMFARAQLSAQTHICKNWSHAQRTHKGGDCRSPCTSSNHNLATDNSNLQFSLSVSFQLVEAM